ncbi:MAG: molybdate ABC transporter permease subunit [Deltaproteobacteria bacterium]|nr:molybdate ABC transporter permease subunit [Deltaproteobacteria bacterium]
MDHSAWFSLWLSTKVAVTSTFFVVIIGTFIGWILARKNFPGKDLLDVFLTLPIVLPPTVTGYYLLLLLGKNGVIGSLIYKYTGYTILFTWHAAVLASFTVSLPLMIKTARSSFESVDINYLEISSILGYSEFETFRTVLIPIAKKGLIAGGILSFARAAGEFGATLMIAGNIPSRTDTMPIMIYSTVSSGEWDKAHHLVLIFSLFSFVILYVSQKVLRKNNGFKGNIF